MTIHLRTFPGQDKILFLIILSSSLSWWPLWPPKLIHSSSIDLGFIEDSIPACPTHEWDALKANFPHQPLADEGAIPCKKVF